jgi:uncharacterized glyoxalase superfamily protein PhnB
MKLKNLRPMLETADLRQTIQQYTELLGFKCGALYPETGEPCWTALYRDEVEIMFTLRNEHSIIEKPTMTGSLYLNVDNVDEAWEQLKDSATIEYPIENFEYGMREFAIRDCNGYLLQFGQDISGD